jgi:L-cysteine desulfidase
MSLLKEILAHEVYPALGCTEPISCAYAAAVAAAELGEPVERVALGVDRGTYKNGAAVTVPHSGGRKGNLIAAVLGGLVAQPGARLEVLRGVTPELLERAVGLVDSGACGIACLEGGPGFRVEAALSGANHTASCVLAGGHTYIERIERDGETVFEAAAGSGDGGDLAYRSELGRMDFAGLLAAAEKIDAGDLAYLKKGVDMNLAMADHGFKIPGTAGQLLRMKEDGYLADDMFFRTKIRVAAAVDGRMAGLEQPVMTSGGSGNQGLVATLTLHGVGKEMKVPEGTILRSIGAAHVINSYVKCFVGELAVICGCAMAAGIAAAAGIVWQQAGSDIRRITLAVNNVIGDLSGLICDGAKPGCAMKTVTSVDAAMRSALMALGGYGLSADEGVVGRTVEDSIRNLGRITLEGMFQVDPTVLDILAGKAKGPGKA